MFLLIIERKEIRWLREREIVFEKREIVFKNNFFLCKLIDQVFQYIYVKVILLFYNIWKFLLIEDINNNFLYYKIKFLFYNFFMDKNHELYLNDRIKNYKNFDKKTKKTKEDEPNWNHYYHRKKKL